MGEEFGPILGTGSGGGGGGGISTIESLDSSITVTNGSGPVTNIQVASGFGVSSFNTRTGAVTLSNADLVTILEAFTSTVGVSMVDTSGANFLLRESGASPIVISSTSSGGIQIDDTGTGGAVLTSAVNAQINGPDNSSIVLDDASNGSFQFIQGAGLVTVNLYLAANLAGLPAVPTAPAFGFTQDGKVYSYPVGGPWSLITGGSVSTVSVVSANGLAGTVATATSTPAITLSTTVNAPALAGNGTAISAATTTGTGSTVVLATSPTLVTPALGTPASGVLTNATGLPIIGGTTGTLSVARGGTGVTTSTGTGNTVLSDSPTFTTTPVAPTAAPGTNTTQLATTAFVTAAVATEPSKYTTSTITADPNPGVVGTYYRGNYAASGNFTLPTSPATGSWIKIKQIANNTLSIVGTVDAITTFSITQYDSVELIYNGTTWDAN